MADNHPTKEQSTKANALINELSPYLLQHAYNPVAWMPWCDDSFQKAMTEQKPVFVSIGYATCHWCHVMEHESFEDQEIADLLNQDFIAIKVDREERPDIDAALMEMCQAMTGHGGWPLSIFMTPDKLPFFAGTYFPKDSIPQRIGFKDILIRIAEGWRNERDAIISSGKDIAEKLTEHHTQSQFGELPPDIFEKADAIFIDRFDEEYAGFGTAPKFPSPHHLIYLLRRAHFTKQNTLADMALRTLKNMSLGGMKDHIGFGFHRYSTDRQWLVPHFEKMLYDQAMILEAMSEAWLYSKDRAYAEYAEEIVSYVQSRLTSPESAFYCAEDADSEGEEGTYYLFTEKELSSILNDKEYAFAKRCFHISSEGNYIDEATRRLNGNNILSHFLDDSLKSEEPELYESIRCKCLAYRENRIPPLLDDKILTDWNAMMIHAMSYAGRVFNKPEWIAHAEQAYAFIKKHMQQGNILYHRYRKGQASIPAMADDHAYLMHALFELYMSTGKEQYVHDCIAHAELFAEKFIEDGGRIKQSDRHELSFHRYASAYDGAIPSCTSIAIMAFAQLSALTGNRAYMNTAYTLIQANGKQFQSYPMGFSAGLTALMYMTGMRAEIVIAGKGKSSERDACLQLIMQTYLPHAVFAYTEDGHDIQSFAPSLAEQTTTEDLAIFMCKDYACSLPIHDLSTLQQQLEQAS
jgi:uncharacterized protein YyaL (SSP411 family)